MENKKRCGLLLLVLMLVCFVYSAQAQQDPLYGLYLNNPLVINPAFAGLGNNLDVNVGYRAQWAGFDGAPTTLNANGSISLYKNRIGAGLQIVQDNIGENKNTGASGLFAYKLNFDKRVVSFGMSAGFVNYRSSPGRLNLQDPDDALFPSVSEMAPALGAGAMVKTDRYLLGVSVPRILAATSGNQLVQPYQRHYYLFASYLFFVSERVVLRPGALLKLTGGNPPSVDANLNVVIDRHYSVGLYARNLNAVGLQAQLTLLDKFRVAYSFEVPTGSSVGARFVTNEVMLGIRTAVFTSHALAPGYF